MATPATPSATSATGSNEVSKPTGVGKAPPLAEKLVFIYEWCKKCGLCVIACPSDALEENEDLIPFLAHPENCKFCSICWKVCPDFAIIKNPNWREENGTE